MLLFLFFSELKCLLSIRYEAILKLTPPNMHKVVQKVRGELRQEQKKKERKQDDSDQEEESVVKAKPET